MTDEVGTSEADTSAEVAPSSGPTETTPTEPPQGNPAWDTYRSKLGDNFFKLIENDLAEDDRRVQQRITEANSRAKQYEGLGSLEQLQAAQQLAQQVGSDPKAVYERLGTWLRQNGMIEAAEAAEDAAEELEDADDTEDPRLTELQQGQQQIQAFLAEQQRQAAVEQATSQFQSQMRDIRGKNEWMSEDDENEILARALSNAQSSNSDVDLAAAAEQYIGLRTRFLSTPRPGASAPRLVPSGGGAPARSSDFDFSKASAEDRQRYVTEYLKNNQ